MNDEEYRDHLEELESLRAQLVERDATIAEQAAHIIEKSELMDALEDKILRLKEVLSQKATQIKADTLREAALRWPTQSNTYLGLLVMADEIEGAVK